MLGYLTGLAACLQVLFTTKAKELGQSTTFIQRQRHLTAADFAQTLVFRWMGNSKTTVEAMAEELEISPQALHQHLGPQAIEFLRSMLVEALRNVIRVAPKPSGLLKKFTAVLVEDASTVALPAELAGEFPGCGGSCEGAGAAALKLLLRWDVATGEVVELSVHAGRTSDQTLAVDAKDVPEGGLHLADQGFFNTGRWQRCSPRQFWISRVPARTRVCVGAVWQSLATLLAGVVGNEFDGPIGLVESTNLSCRLVARRCPEEVANRRRQKLRDYTRSKKGREPSAEQLALCGWVIFATNVPVEMLSPKELWLVYRCRWQIELFFKRAKSLLGLCFSWGRNGTRILVEVYAKLLAVVVVHWASLLAGTPLNRISNWKRWRVVQGMAERILDSLSQGVEAVLKVLTELATRLHRIRPQATCRKRPTTRQLLNKPSLAT